MLLEATGGIAQVRNVVGTTVVGMEPFRTYRPATCRTALHVQLVISAPTQPPRLCVVWDTTAHLVALRRLCAPLQAATAQPIRAPKHCALQASIAPTPLFKSHV